MTAPERQQFEHSVGELLALSPDDRHATWGRCSPPCRYAATVVQLNSRCRHQFRSQAAGMNVDQGGSGLFWGAARGEDGTWHGDNWLGLLWMERRCELAVKRH